MGVSMTMFHSRAGRGRDSSSSSSTRSSFHTANDSLESEDEIKTIIASSSSEAAEIPSLVLGQRSYSSGRVTSGTVEEDYESHYSTAKSSFDSRYRSDTFYTATSHSGRRDSSSLYSSEFESDDSVSLTESNVEQEFENDEDAEKHFLKAKLKSLRREKQEIRELKPEGDKEFDAEMNKFVKIQLATLLHRRKKGTALVKPPRSSDTTKDKKSSKQGKGSQVSSPLIPCGVVERLRIQNLLHSMKRASQAPLHEIDKCESCRKVKESVMEKDFMRSKHRHVYNQLTEERYRQHIVNHDPLSEIGNLASALPKLSSDPKEIWKQLMQNGIT
ncbi:uncharacterized protein C8orf48 homolog isoform X1 [Strongylocentrotus purpuratus]|uniref:Uncharacterized protein n=2 Tax=Strongylocentrotus purpuratus TaxID=7668 RepID=A0A7M7GHY4_STRPU|nr:uncharacterized protein C8orf48 homolog isoform X1 [Strongylocentrotus purpuratus]